MPSPDLQHAPPEAPLALAKEENRGRLKIFLGAAPGVGKTYAMLAAARAEKESGREVVIGLVRTHRRAETEALVEGLEVLPRKFLVHKNRRLPEFDIDAALARRPGLLLVDEFAHTNFSGCRNPKRWQDVEELLVAGINVWTTLNIRNLESLKDVIRKITRMPVPNTVPDRTFEQAEEIVLVDLPPDELLKRLADGKVYMPGTRGSAARAVEKYFKPQNLRALRELALRRVAERVAADPVEPMQAQAIKGPWAAGERILACIGPDALSPLIVRTAARLAKLMDAPWTLVTVERPGTHLDDTQRRRVDEAVKLAQGLGAEIKVLVGNDLTAEILRFSKLENVTQIVIGRSRSGILAELFRRSLPHELIQRVEDIVIHLVTGRGEPASWLSRIPGAGRGTLPSLMSFARWRSMRGVSPNAWPRRWAASPPGHRPPPGSKNAGTPR